jgi:hypothetical protein
MLLERQLGRYDESAASNMCVEPEEMDGGRFFLSNIRNLEPG